MFEYTSDPLYLTLGILILTVTAITAFMSVYSFSRREVIGSAELGFLCLAATAYVGGYAMELLSISLDAKIGWNLVQYLGIPFLAPLWVLLALRFAGHENRINWPVRFLLFVIPVLTSIFRFNDDWYHLQYSTYGMDVSGFVPMLGFTPGPWYYVHGAFVTVCLVFATYLYLSVIFRAHTHLRIQSILQIAASLAPWAALYLNVTVEHPLGLDIGVLGMGIGAMLTLLALTRYRFLAVMPIAHFRIFESSSDGLLVIDRFGRFVDYNPSAARFLPELTRDCVGRPAVGILAPYPEILKALAGEGDTLQRVVPETGPRSLKIQSTKLKGNLGAHVGNLLSLQDISDMINRTERLLELTTLDELSGAYNQKAFMDRASEEFVRADRNRRKLTYILVDLDAFQLFNDEMGVPVGDQAIRICAGICRAFSRTTDVIGCLGGETFALLLPETDESEAIRVAERIRAAISSYPFEFEGRTHHLTASFGVAETHLGSGSTLEIIMGRSARALLRAKADGKDRVVCYSSFNDGG
jgi:diguanylate cyclase (GGDEF)-like protein